MRASVRRFLLFPAIAIWIGAAGFGYLKLVRYENAPGSPPSPLDRWPAASAIERSPTRAALVMVVHPLCSCTRASLEELALILARAPGLADAHVLFFKPAEFTDNWTQTDLWTAAAAIPGVHVRIDEKGQEAKLFRASTSGSVMLYDRDGRLLFTGGITSSRAHSGDNAGADAIVSLLAHGNAERKKTFVFGCSLLDARADGPKQ
jgi:hypothetical protein